MAAWMMACGLVRPNLRGRVVGLGLGRFAWIGAGVALAMTVCPSAWMAPALAGPEGAKVAHGAASINRAGDVTTIVASDRTVINYSSFNIASHETVRFVQPDAASRVLNRIQGPDPTRIDGSLLANGRVYIVNPAGVYFSAGSLVNVGGIYAAAANISDVDFLGGRDRFTGAMGSVVNEGTIVAHDIAALVGRNVSNAGMISADSGLIVMAAGEDVYVSELGSRIMAKFGGSNAPVGDATKPGVQNTGTVRAQRAFFGAGDMYASALDMGGLIEARRIEARGGKDGVVAVTGTLDASTDVAGKRGGTVHVLGDRVGLVGATIDASGPRGGGEVLVGGDFRGEGSIHTAQRTYADSTTRIDARATDNGDGGKVILWADDWTKFHGQIDARGGAQGGDGGFVEVSGKQTLVFLGGVDTSAVMGKVGTLLLDPATLNIIDAAAGGDQDPTLTGSMPVGQILATDPDIGANTVSWGAIDGLASSTNVILEATGLITIEDVTGAAGGTITSNNLVLLDLDTGSLRITSTGGSILFDDPADVIRTEGGAITLEALGGDITAGGFNTTGAGGAESGNVTLTATGNIGVGNVLTGGGLFTATADSDASGAGNFLQNAATSINSGAGGTTISGVVVDTLGITSTTNVLITGNTVSIDGAIAGTNSVTIEGTGTPGDTIEVNAAVTSASGTVSFEDATSITFTVDQSTPNLLRVQNIATVNLAADVDLTGTNGLAMSTGVTTINLTGGGGTTNILSGLGSGSVNLANITGASGPNLTVISDHDVNMGSVAIGAGTLEVTADNDNNSLNTLTIGAMTAGQITVSGGTDLNEIILIQGDATSAGGLTIRRADALNLGMNVDLTANGAALSLDTDVAGIDLISATGTNILTSRGDADISMPAITGSGANLTARSEGALSLDSVAIGAGALVAQADFDNDTILASLTTNGITAGTVTLRGGSHGFNVIFATDSITSDTSILVDQAALLDLAQDVNLTANNGALTVSALTMNLDGAAGTNVLTSLGDALISLPQVTTSGAAGMTIASEGGVTLGGSFNINAGVLSIAIDTNNNGSNTLSATGTVTATGITLSGLGGNDTFDLDANVVSLGALLFDDALLADLGGSLSATTTLTIQDVATVNMAANRNMTAGGNLLAHAGVTQISLVGAGGTNTFTATGEGNINLAPVVSSNNAALTATAQGNITLASANTGTGNVTLSADSNNNTVLANLTTGAIAGGAISLQAGATANDTIDVTGSLAGTSVSIAQALAVDLAQAVDLSASAGALTVSTLTLNLSGAGGTNTLTSLGGTTISLPQVTTSGAAGLTIASEGGVTLGGSLNIGAGALAITVDSNNTTVETLHATGTVTAGGITLSGMGGDDLFDLDGNVTSTAAMLIQDAATAEVGGNLGATTTLTLQDIGMVDLAAGRTVTAGGNLLANTGVGQIRLTGAGGTNTFTATGEGNINLGPVVSTNNATLVATAQGNVTLASANVGTGDVTLSADSNNNTALASVTTGAITGNAITLRGGTTVNDLINITGDIAGTTIVIQQAITADLAQDVDLTATGGALTITASTLNLSGAGGTNTLTTTGGSLLSLPQISSTGAANLVVLSDGGVTLNGSVNTAGGSLAVTVDADNNGAATLLANGAVTATGITFTGTGGDDTFDLNGNVTSMGDLLLDNATLADIENDLSATGALTIQNIPTVDLAVDASLSAGGDLLVHTGVTAINLSGAGGTNAFTATGEGDVQLAPVTSASNASLTVTAQGNVTLDAVNLGMGTLTASADSDNDTVGATMMLQGVTAGTIGLFGGTDLNDSLTVAGDLDATGLGITVLNFGSASFQAITSAAGINIAATTIMYNGAVMGMGPISFTGNTALTNDITSGGGAMTFSGNVTLGADVILTSGGGSISVTGTTNADAAANARALTFDAGTGNITLTGATGTTEALGALTFASAGSVTTAAVTARTITQLAGTGTTTFGGAINTSQAGGLDLTGNAFTFNGPVTTTGGGGVNIVNAGTLTTGAGGDFNIGGAFTQSGAGLNVLAGDILTQGQAISFATNATISGTATFDTTSGGAPGANISFGGTVNGATAGLQNLILTAGTGDVSFASTVGVTTRLGALGITSADAVTFGGALRSAGLTVDANSLTLGAVNTSSALGVDVTADTMTLAGAITTTGGGGLSVTNSGQANIGIGGPAFVLAGDFTQAGGGPVSFGAMITTPGDISFASPVTLTRAVTLAANDVTFGSTIGASVGTADLTINTSGGGVTTFNGAVGGIRALNVGSDGMTRIGASITGSAGITLGNDVVLIGNSTITGNSITFSDTVNSDATARNLIVNSTGGGTTTFNGAVGGTSALASLVTNGDGTTVLGGGAVTTTGAQTFGDPVNLTSDTTLAGSDVTFAGALNSSGANRALTVTTPGTAVFGGSVGATMALSSLTTGGGGTTSFGGATVRTVNAQTFNDAVLLTGNAVEFTATNASGTITFGGTLDGPGAATINAGGDTTFAGVIGGTGALASLVTDPAGRTLLNAGALTTTGAQTFGDAVLLGANTTFTGGSLTFGGTLNSDATPRSLVANVGGDTRFSGVVGGANPLTSIQTNTAGTTTLAGGAITTIGSQIYGDVVTLAANTALTAETVNFSSTVNSDGTARNLNVALGASGTLTFNATVGAASPLASLSVQGGSARLGASVTTNASQTYASPVVLLQNVTLSGMDLSFENTVDSGTTARELSLNVGTGGTTRFGGVIGATSILEALSITGGTTTFVALPSVSTLGDQTYMSDIVLENAGGTFIFAANDITVGGTLNAQAGSMVDVEFNTLGNGMTRLLGDIGGTQAVASLTTNADGTTQLGADITADGGTITFNNPVVMVGDSTLLDMGGTGIIFGSTIEDDGNGRALALRVTERAADANQTIIPLVMFGGNVGETNRLGSLAVGVNGRSTAARVGTIVSGLDANGQVIPNHSLTIRTSGDFTMTQGEKLVVLGDLTIDAQGRATIADLTALGTITVTASAISIVERAGAVLAENLNGSLFINPQGPDSGVDFVAGDGISFSVAPDGPLTGGGAIRAATRDGQNMTLNDGGVIFQQAFVDFGLTSLLLGNLVLDVRAQGPSPTNVVEAIAGAMLLDTNVGRVEPPGVIGRSAREELRQLGIEVREMSTEDMLDTLIGRALYNDLPGKPIEDRGDYLVTMNRLPEELVRSVLERRRNLFTPPPDFEPAAPRIRDSLAASWGAYSASAGEEASADGFREFLATSEEYAESHVYVSELGILLHELQLLGLTSVEYGIARSRILGDITPPNIDPDVLRETIEGARPE